MPRKSHGWRSLASTVHGVAKTQSQLNGFTSTFFNRKFIMGLKKVRGNVWVKTSVEVRIKRAGGGIEDVNATRQRRADGKNSESTEGT